MTLKAAPSTKTLLLLLVLPLLFACSEPPYQNVSNEGLKTLMQQGVPVIDIRTAEEWRETGVVPGSHKLTFFNENGTVNPAFLPRFESIVQGSDQAFALICRTGNRTSALARILTDELGYQAVYNVERGITHWIGSRNPIQR